MEIVYRNLISMMSAGAFATEAKAEPMNHFKWEQLLTLSATYNVDDYVAAGIIEASARDSKLIPKDILENAYAKQNATAADMRREKNETDITKADTSKFANIYLNHKLKKLVYNEIHSIDTSTATLKLLYMIIDNINGVISYGIDFRQAINLGRYLRTNGDKIDFVKLEQWIKTLHIVNPSRTVGGFLISLFGFSVSEVQFTAKPDGKAWDKALKPLRRTLEKASKEPDIRDYNDKMRQRTYTADTRSLTRLRYFPSEIICKFVSGVGRSLSNIEE